MQVCSAIELPFGFTEDVQDIFSFSRGYEESALNCSCDAWDMNAVLKLQKAYDCWNSMWSDWEKTANQFFTKPGLAIKGAAKCEAMDTSPNNLHIASAQSTSHFGQWEPSKVRRKWHTQI